MDPDPGQNAQDPQQWFQGVSQDFWSFLMNSYGTCVETYNSNIFSVFILRYSVVDTKLFFPDLDSTFLGNFGFQDCKENLYKATHFR